MYSPKILLIEDEAEILEVNKSHLEEQGYTVLTAQTLKDAKAGFDTYIPDLIILDIMLPDGSGFDFCNEIKQYTTAPIIFLSCLDANDDIVRGLAIGGDDYITKPFNLNVLSARVYACLRRAGILSVGQIDLPPLSIDLQKSKVRLYNDTIILSLKELQLLAYLVSHAGRECPVDTLYESVWGNISNNATATIKVHISSIRKKLKLNENSPFIIRHTKNKAYIFMKIAHDPEW